MNQVAGVLLTTPEAAERLGVSSSLLKRWRRTCVGPRFVSLGSRLVRYNADDLEVFILRLGKAQEGNFVQGDQQSKGDCE